MDRKQDKMRIRKEKHLLYAVIFAAIGWINFFAIDCLNYLDWIEQFEIYPGILSMPKSGKYDTLLFKLIPIVFGLISLYFSINSKSSTNKKSKIFIILIALLLIIDSIIFFPNLFLNAI